MEGYLTISEVAKKWGISSRRVQKMCSEGRIEGVTKFGRVWVLPGDVEKPADARVTTGAYRNWRKPRGEKISK